MSEGSPKTTVAMQDSGATMHGSMIGQHTDAAERSAHVTRGVRMGRGEGCRIVDPFVGPEFGPVRLRVVAELEAKVAQQRAALLQVHTILRDATHLNWEPAMEEAEKVAREALGDDGTAAPAGEAALRPGDAGPPVA